MRPGVDAVLLDVDDTLVDTRAAFRSAMDVVARSYLAHLDDAPALALEHWVRDAAGHFDAFTRGELTFERQRRLRLVAMHEALGGPVVDDELFEAWNALYDKAFRASWAPLPGARELLRALVAAGVPFGSVTNSQVSYQTDKLVATGLRDLRVLVGTDTLGFGKPDPRVFRRGCELLGSDPSRTVYVGDEPLTDADGATQAGLTGVWLDRWGEGLRPDSGSRRPSSGVPVVGSLAELASWLQLGS